MPRELQLNRPPMSGQQRARTPPRGGGSVAGPPPRAQGAYAPGRGAPPRIAGAASGPPPRGQAPPRAASYGSSGPGQRQAQSPARGPPRTGYDVEAAPVSANARRAASPARGPGGGPSRYLADAAGGSGYADGGIQAGNAASYASGAKPSAVAMDLEDAELLVRHLLQQSSVTAGEH